MPLWIVATPIGNLQDLTFRAEHLLRTASGIYAEDTRRARGLLGRLGITRHQVHSYHEHSSEAVRDRIVAELAAGESIVLISDAGTPGISDPGFRLVHEVRQRGLEVSAVPGPCAVVAFLSASGLPTDAFTFQGFPPRKRGQRARLLAGSMAKVETQIFYESPRRVTSLLKDIRGVDAERLVVCGRELTKIHEEWIYGTATEVHEELASRDSVLGEFVVGIAGAPSSEVADADVEKWIELLSPYSLSTKELAQVLAKGLDTSSSEVYEMILRTRT